jgi:hypothetical protein
MVSRQPKNGPALNTTREKILRSIKPIDNSLDGWMKNNDGTDLHI